MNLSKQPKISSLKNKSQIQDLLKSNEKVFTKYGIIFLKNDKECSDIKSAILIKKKCGNAVKRNYIKRLIRYFVREHAVQLGKHNRFIFLYLYQGKIKYSELETIYLKAMNRYEENFTNSH